MTHQVNQSRLPQWVGEHFVKIAEVKKTAEGFQVTSRYGWSWPTEDGEPLHHLQFTDEVQAAQEIKYLEPGCDCSECQKHRHYHNTKGPAWTPHRKLLRDPLWTAEEWIHLEELVYILQYEANSLKELMQTTDEPITYERLHEAYVRIHTIPQQLINMSSHVWRKQQRAQEKK